MAINKSSALNQEQIKSFLEKKRVDYSYKMKNLKDQMNQNINVNLQEFESCFHLEPDHYKLTVNESNIFTAIE